MRAGSVAVLRSSDVDVKNNIAGMFIVQVALWIKGDKRISLNINLMNINSAELFNPQIMIMNHC